MAIERVVSSDSSFPDGLRILSGKESISELFILGNPDLLSQSWLALFCSSKCPGSLILQAYDLALAMQKAGASLAGGFHSPVEQDTLKIALRGEQQIIVCPARGLDGMRISVEYRKPLDHGRLLLASVFPATLKRPTTETAYERNRFVAALAEKVLVIHAEPGGKLAPLCQEVLAWGKPLYTLENEDNRALIEMGAQIYPG